jgi:hypothetical protein
MTFLHPSSAHSSHFQGDEADKRVEYSVYTVGKAEASGTNHSRWEMKYTTSDKRHAFARARVLHRSHDYSRVEIMRKVCCDQDVCRVDEGYKVFEHKESRGRRDIKVALFLLTTLVSACGLTLIF